MDWIVYCALITSFLGICNMMVRKNQSSLAEWLPDRSRRYTDSIMTPLCCEKIHFCIVCAAMLRGFGRLIFWNTLNDWLDRRIFSTNCNKIIRRSMGNCFASNCASVRPTNLSAVSDGAFESTSQIASMTWLPVSVFGFAKSLEISVPARASNTLAFSQLELQ